MSDELNVHAFRLLGTTQKKSVDGDYFPVKVYELVAEDDPHLELFCQDVAEPTPDYWVTEQPFWANEGQRRDEWLLVYSNQVVRHVAKYAHFPVPTDDEARGILNYLNRMGLTKSDPSKVFKYPEESAHPGSGGMAGPDVIVPFFIDLDRWWMSRGGKQIGDPPLLRSTKDEAFRWLYDGELGMYKPPIPPDQLALDTTFRTAETAEDAEKSIAESAR